MKRVAIFGFGYWGPNWARTVHLSPEVSLEVVIDPDAGRRAHAKKLFPLCQVVPALTDQDLSSIDVAILATPPNTHVATIEAVARTGVSTVIVEKPLCLSRIDVDAIYAITDSAGTNVIVDYTFTHTPAATFLAAHFADFGPIEAAYSHRHNLGIFRPDMSVLWDLTVHDLAVFDMLFGPLNEAEVCCVTSRSLGSSNDSTATTIVRAPNRPQLTSSVSWISPAKIRQMSFHGTKGMVVWDDQAGNDPVKVYPASKASGLGDLLEYRTGDAVYPRVSGPSPLEGLLSIAVGERAAEQAAIDRARTERITGILEAAEVSVAEGSRFVPVR